MAKIAEEDRRQFHEKIKPYKAEIQALLNREGAELRAMKEDPQGAGGKRLSLAEDMLDLASNYIIINGISQAMIKLKEEEALNNGRKTLYKSIIYMEDVVSNLVDAPYSDYEEKLEAIAGMDAKSRYLLVRKAGLAIQLLENAYGDNTKWRWAFVELDGRFAAVAKNIIDLKNAVSNTDPRSPDYTPTLRHLRLIKKLLTQAADKYRQKYELATNRMDDFKMGINFLLALRRIHILLGERNEAEEVKKKFDIWSAKLETDIKRSKE